MSNKTKMRIREEKFRLNLSVNDVQLEQVDDNTQDSEALTTIEDEYSEPNLVKTNDGRLVIEMQRGRTCGVCKEVFPSLRTLNKHKLSCVDEMDEFEDVLQKEKIAALDAQPGEEFFKYCNPNPENPCYCCGEDISTAHVGHIKCKLCPKSFKAYEYMEKHLISVHSDNENFACSQCNAKCPSLKVLQEHMQTHCEGKPFSCLKCGKDFTRKYHLERHLNHSSCGDAPKQTLPCEVCGKEFTRLDNLREHLRFHMGQGSRKRDYQCPYCPKSFYGSSLLNIHIRTHTGEKPFPCDLCSKSFPSTGALRKHRRSHTGERPYRCDQCSATFAARETLNRHRKTHTGDKPHQCTVCDKRFIQATQLRSHMFNHTGENGFECEQCGAAFNRKTRLEEHVRYVHNKEKPLQCDICLKEFVRKEDLSRHMDTHSEVKNFICDVCQKRFVSNTALKVHQRTHRVEEAANCTICKRNFIRKDCLMRHMRSKHREFLNEKIALDEGEILLEVIEEREQPEQSEPEKDQVLEIDGEVYQITPVEDIQIVQISRNTSNDRNEKVVEVVEIKPPIERTRITEFPLAEAPATKNKPKQKRVKTKTETVTNIEENLIVPVAEQIVELETSPSKKPVKERKKRKRVPDADSVEVTSTKIKQEQPDDSMPIFLNDDTLKQKISELLCLLIDEEILKEFGWPKAPVEEVLANVIKRCGHKPAADDDTGDYTTRMRENTKILFSLMMDDYNIKILLNNHTVDEVIMKVLKSK